MKATFQEFLLDLPAKRRLVAKVGGKPEVFSFEDDPALASLCTCLGLQFELGNRDYDRLSPFFGIDDPETGENPWMSKIIVQEGELGLWFTRRDRKPLKVRHQDFGSILDPLSFDERGRLSRLVVFPGRVARAYRRKGFELVIVRDWVLTSSLNLDENTRVPYLLANDWEIRNNIARTQAALMVRNRLAFSGTHDVADHLLGADLEEFDLLKSLYLSVDEELGRIFSGRRAPTNSQLVLSYFIGVLLDDLAQPRWYGSQNHERLVREALSLLPQAGAPGDVIPLRPPPAFHGLVDELRSPGVQLPRLHEKFTDFLAAI